MAYLLESSACMIIFYALFHIVYRGSKSHRSNRIYIISALLLSFIIPLVSIPMYADEIMVAEIAQQTGSPKTLLNPISTEPSSNIYLIIYFLGVLIFSLKLIIDIISTITLIRQSNRTKRNGYSFYCTEKDVPLSSIFGYIIAPTQNIEHLTPYELHHESQHIKYKHSYDVLLMEIITILQWYNPIIYLYKKSLVEIHEYQADSATGKKFGLIAYQDFLISSLEKSHRNKLVNNFYSIFKQRLIMMNSKSKFSNWRYLYACPLVLITFIFFSFEEYPRYVDKQGKEITIKMDTLTPGTVYDTLPWYNHMLNKQVKYVVAKPAKGKAYILPHENPKLRYTGVDTITTVDYDTFAEETIIYNFENGSIDTIN